jgi:hypothetical protein
MKLTTSQCRRLARGYRFRLRSPGRSARSTARGWWGRLRRRRRPGHQRTPSLMGEEMALTMSLIERVRVQRRIARASAVERPVPWATLAAQEGIPERTRRHMHREWIEVQEFYDDPLGVVGEALDTYTALMEEAAKDFQNAPPGNVRIGAMRVVIDLTVAATGWRPSPDRALRRLSPPDTAASQPPRREQRPSPASHRRARQRHAAGRLPLRQPADRP